MQSDGKIVAVGGLNTKFTPSEETISSVILVRYNPDGSLDATFGDGGIVIDQPSPLIHGRGVAIDSSGRILVGAQRWAGFEPGDPSYMALLRYLPDGARDAAFGTAGVAESSFANGRHELHDLAINGVGRIVSIGRSAPFNGNTDFGIVRHLATGELDGDFGTAGMVTFDFSGGGDDGLAVVIDMADRVVVAGSSDTTAVHGSVARLGIDGQLDDTFGVDGHVMTTASPVKLTSVGVSPADDSILAAGWIAQQSQSIVLARFDSLGAIDPSFGTGGLAVAPPGNLDDLASDLAIQSDRKIIVAATRLESSVPPLSDFLVARYCP